ncbi:DUF2283 domain-containing protein [Actinomyces faecalis]|uniref:DUF2283 domain-containing protein n=1 Tax=Actinomyces faecalis TaxID=2722820 RepID=UPI0015557826|nr:DUF2283 domain-containing protein [Actinomyces faecalis]
MSAPHRTVTLDPEVRACYISLSDDPIAETFEYSEDVFVDLNEMGVAVGIEVLNLNAKFPLHDLTRALHIHSKDEPFLASFLPNLAVSLRFDAASAADSTIMARTSSARQPA